MALTTGVLHLVDSLDPGGAEHMAVMLANHLPQENYRSYLCASRHAGPLRERIQPHVVFYDLRRRGMLDLPAVFRLAAFTRREKVNIIHAHSTSLFLGTFICMLNPKLYLVWHDHFGLQGKRSRPVGPYRLFASHAQAVFSVTKELMDWAVDVLRVSPERVLYLPNFVETVSPQTGSLELPGKTGKRIVCVANIRFQKDHLTLVRALRQVVQIEPEVHLILVGAETDVPLAGQLKEEIARLGLERNLSFLGPRQDVPSILSNCNIGVLSSVSEGFPVVLLEYGRAGLAVAATRVGECAEILEDGEAGLLVLPSDPEALASALIKLLGSQELQNEYSKRLKSRVEQNYSPVMIEQRVCQVYECILAE